MRRGLILALMIAAVRAAAGPVGAGDPDAAKPTGFPGAYLGTVELSLADDPQYGSRLLGALDTHLQAVGVMTSRAEVESYLEQSATGSEDAKTLLLALGREPLDTAKASALLLADALARPLQFREVIDGLDRLKTGMGREAASMLRAADGTGDKKLLASLHAAGSLRRGDKPQPYLHAERLAPLFDATSSDEDAGTVLNPPDEAAPSPRTRGADSIRPERP